MNKCICICCDKKLDAELSDNPVVISPVYGGIIFRSTGNYGSSIFDPITEEEILQIVICDDCIRNKIKRVIHIYDIQRDVVAQSKPLDPDEERC